MDLYGSSSCLLYTLVMAISIFLFMLFLPIANSLSFNFTTFDPNMADISFQGDAFTSNNVLQLTKNEKVDDNDNFRYSVGRASYKHPVRLWDAKTRRLTDFTAHFSFIMKRIHDKYQSGDGMSFFIAPVDSQIPDNSSGGFLALFNNDTALNASKENQIIAVEFDSFKNAWDPDGNHVGILVNSIISVTNVTWNSSITNGSQANAWVSYNSTTRNLSVFLTYAQNPVFSGNSSLSYIVDLRDFLPEWVRVGFSASTGMSVELHNIISWDFDSSLEINQKARHKTGLLVCISVDLGIFACAVIGVFWLVFWRKRHGGRNEDEADDVSMDDEFEKRTGPKRFTFAELSRATSDFAESGKLGEGGFGGVYKGLLSESNTQIAVKKFSRGSKQGKKEYVSEVKIITRLRHRNLVQLIGLCHERGEFLLVYEFLPNGSLDSHLFGGETMLIWSVRYKIAFGLASALLYLHEEWEQCVVHRDIKSSNVMLDSNFNAKLGDFGLARLVDHELGSQTTVLAGTMGYLAPECVTTGKASKESDVYGFGVVALEITSGRRPVDTTQEPNKVRLVE
ncbi:L-type lectin-domain containing receptor kinase IX.1-like [Hevea brasiliensis]|uniref:L-type lectin-domain containing receptor kinase IX.1-like n=1 Tax=Hevea brasiliensis TaxID=3981 RepID=UPI0025E03FC4|nr:L-type lectin-domain containing receptor kinase IX.1-like [Hevea brasiliensis]